MKRTDTKWRRGLPPGRFYEGMTDDYECYPTIAGGWWHRRRTPEEAAAHRAQRLEATQRMEALDGRAAAEAVFNAVGSEGP